MTKIIIIIIITRMGGNIKRWHSVQNSETYVFNNNNKKIQSHLRNNAEMRNN